MAWKDIQNSSMDLEAVPPMRSESLPILQQETLEQQQVGVASGLDPWTDSYTKIKDAIIRNEQVEVAAEDQWRIPYLKKLLVLMQDLKAMAMDEAQEELKELIDSLVL